MALVSTEPKEEIQIIVDITHGLLQLTSALSESYVSVLLPLVNTRAVPSSDLPGNFAASLVSVALLSWSSL